MKIVDIRTIPLTWNATSPCMSAWTVSSSRSALIVTIATDTGIVGIGEAGDPLNEPFDYDGAGCMRLPTAPGLGVTLNRDTIERYRVG